MAKGVKIRLNLVLSDRDYARVARIRKKLELASDTAAMREAIRRLAKQLEAS